MPRPPMVAIVGKKHSGKTTLTVRLAAELGKRGHRVMTIKHGSHTFNIDPESTDTFRHYHEGKAERVAMAAPDKFALVMHWDVELEPEDIAERYMSDADVVICEGFKKSALPRIEIYRRAAHAEPLYGTPEYASARYLAVVTDVPSLRLDVPVISLENAGWLQELAALVESEIIHRSRTHDESSNA